MGDISMRGKGKALKMKEGGRAASRDLKALGPTLKGRRKKRVDGATKRRAEEASMRELRYPTSKPKRRRPTIEPDRGPVKPMPMPMPRPDRPNMKPMPYKRPKLPKDLEKYMMDMPRRVRPAMKKDGGEMKFGAAADVNKIKEGLKSLGSVGTGVGVGKLYDAIKKLKPSGRINMDDIKKTLESMKKAKKIDMSPGRRKAMTGSETGKTRGEKLAESLKNRPAMKKPKAMRRQMAKKVSKRLI